jgi:phosphoglycolate phosphatase-like HAD superfamily hydrolase
MDWQLNEAKKWIIITDLDGTIIDSETANSRILQQVLEEFGYTEQRITVMRMLAEGTEVKEVTKQLNVTPEIKKQFEERMKSLLNQAPVPLLPGARENIEDLKNLGFLFCLVTDNYSQTVAHMIKEHNLNDVFESKFILTIDTFPQRKPSSDIAKELKERSGREEVIILGNSPKEVAMARNLRCPAVIITEWNRIGSSTMKKYNFEYELETFGEMYGEDIYCVKDWKEARDAIIEIIQKKSRKW